MAKRNIIECDVCNNEIKTWEKIRIKKDFIGASFDLNMIFPVDATVSKYIYICPDCINRIKEYCTREATG